MKKTIGDLRKILKERPELSPRLSLYGRDTAIAAINAINRFIVEALPDETELPEKTTEHVEELEYIVRLISKDKAKSKKSKKAKVPDL